PKPGPLGEHGAVGVDRPGDLQRLLRFQRLAEAGASRRGRREGHNLRLCRRWLQVKSAEEAGKKRKTNRIGFVFLVRILMRIWFPLLRGRVGGTTSNRRPA